jgi:hypothetical protein
MKSFCLLQFHFRCISVLGFVIWSQYITSQIINQPFDTDPNWQQVVFQGSGSWAWEATGGNPAGNIRHTAPAGGLVHSAWYYTTVQLDPCRQYSAQLEYIRELNNTSARIVIAIGTVPPTSSGGGFELLNQAFTAGQGATTWTTISSTQNFFPKVAGTYYFAVRVGETSGTSSPRHTRFDNIQLIDAGASNQCRGCDCADCAASSGLFNNWSAANSGSGGCTTVSRSSNGLDETFCSTWTMPVAPPATQAVGFFHLLTYAPSSCQSSAATRELFASCGTPISSDGNDIDGRPYWILNAGQTYTICITRTSNGACTTVSTPCTRPYVANVVIMPVRFGIFTAVKERDRNILKWTTHLEQNNEGFEVQRAIGGKDFHPIGFVSGHGNSHNELQYEFIDPNPERDINLYRLKQMDFDGQYEYSHVVAVRSDSKGKIIILNNVCTHTLNLLLPDDASEAMHLEILTSSGQAIRKQYLKEQKELSIDVSDLPEGMYFIKTGYENGSIQLQRWIKQ